MVLSTSAADAEPRAQLAPWIERIGKLLRLAQRGLLVLVDQADDAQLAPLVRALLAEYPGLEVLAEAGRIEDVSPGSVVVLVPRPQDATYLNLIRPLFAERSLRVVLFCKAETAAALAKSAPDFFDWISRRVECPRAAAGHAICGLRAALCKRAWMIGYRGANLEAAFFAAFPGRTFLRVDGQLPFGEMVATIRDAGRAYLVWSNIGDSRNLRRVRWAMAEAGRRSRSVLALADWERLDLEYRVEDRTAAFGDAVSILSGAVSPARLAALLDLEPEAITLAGELLAAGVSSAEMEAALVTAADPGAALARLALGRGIGGKTAPFWRVVGVGVDVAGVDEVEALIRRRPRSIAMAESLRRIAEEAGYSEISGYWARRVGVEKPAHATIENVGPLLANETETQSLDAVFADNPEGRLTFEQFAARYRECVSRLHNRLRTLGIPSETRRRDRPMDLPLDQLFIPLRLVPDRDKNASQAFSSVLRSKGSAVVLADPGMGKTTLLAYIALVVAGSVKLEGTPFSPCSLPLHISLRDFVRRHKETPSLSFLDYLTSEARDRYGIVEAHSAFFETALRMGEAVVLLDGLDEVGNEAGRLDIAHKIRMFRAEFSDCPFWITSRIYGYTENVRFTEATFAHYRIERLDDEQIDEFVEHWYALQIPEDPAEAKEQAESLRSAIHRTKSVRRLAGKPLLLTLMAFIHHGMRKLPKDRGELYEKCVEMLLKTWQEAKRKEGEAPRAMEGLVLHVPTQKDYLAHLAFFVQQKNEQGRDKDARGLVSRREALNVLGARHLARAKRERPELNEAEARYEMERFLEYISDETGLLIDRGNDLLSFIHLSFQEYLAAWVFLTGTDVSRGPEFFVEHLGDPTWEEVLLLRLYIVLWGNGGGETEFDRIVGTILRALERKDSQAGWLTLTRAIRDDLEFTERDRKTILARALAYWLDKPSFAGPWFLALEEIKLFATKGSSTLRALLIELQTDPRTSPKNFIACLFLETRLFGFPKDGSGRLRGRADLPLLLADLVAFRKEPGMAALLAEKATLWDWERGVQAADGEALHVETMQWVVSSPAALATEAATSILWGKLASDLRSRHAFAKERRAHADAILFERPGRIVFATEFSSVTLPYSALIAPRVQLFIGKERSGTDLFCAELASMGESVHRELPAVVLPWATELIRSQLRPFEGAKPIEASTIRAFAEASGRHFVFAFVRVRLLGLWRGRDFGRDFGRDLIRSFKGTSDNHPHERVLNVYLGRNNSGDLHKLFRGIWSAASVHHVLTALRECAVTHPNKEIPDSALETWLHHHPFTIYATAFAWSEHLKTAPPLRGPAGALFITHAAYAALMTGLPCALPETPADLSDPRIRVALLFHEIAHFRDADANIQKLNDEIANAGPELRPMLEIAGLGDPETTPRQ